MYSVTPGHTMLSKTTMAPLPKRAPTVSDAATTAPRPGRFPTSRGIGTDTMRTSAPHVVGVRREVEAQGGGALWREFAGSISAAPQLVDPGRADVIAQRLEVVAERDCAWEADITGTDGHNGHGPCPREGVAAAVPTCPRRPIADNVRMTAVVDRALRAQPLLRQNSGSTTRNNQR